MGQLYLVRHADAGDRHDHDGADDLRPLSPRGQRQAEGVAELLADAGITELRSSPFLRCVQTLGPLGARLGLVVEPEPRLAEGAGAAALGLATDLRKATSAFCSHGDVIPDILDALRATGLRLEDELRWQKASTWLLRWDGDRPATGRYLPPPH